MWRNHIRSAISLLFNIFNYLDEMARETAQLFDSIHLKATEQGLLELTSHEEKVLFFFNDREASQQYIAVFRE